MKLKAKAAARRKAEIDRIIKKIREIPWKWKLDKEGFIVTVCPSILLHFALYQFVMDKPIEIGFRPLRDSLRCGVGTLNEVISAGFGGFLCNRNLRRRLLAATVNKRK